MLGLQHRLVIVAIIFFRSNVFQGFSLCMIMVVINYFFSLCVMEDIYPHLFSISILISKLERIEMKV